MKIVIKNITRRNLDDIPGPCRGCCIGSFLSIWKVNKRNLGSQRRRGFKVVETFARTGSANNPSGPIELYLKSNFHIKDETDHEFPLVRLEF